MARSGEEELLGFPPPRPVRPVDNVQQRVSIVVILVPDVPNLRASSQIVKLNLGGETARLTNQHRFPTCTCLQK